MPDSIPTKDDALSRERGANPFETGAAATRSATWNDSGNRSSYSLLLLFYLTTLAAILVAACRMAFTAKGWTWQLFAFSYMIAGSSLIILAVAAGWWIGRRIWTVGLGILAGSVCGLLAVLMMLVQPVHYLSAGLILGIGSWLLSVIAVLANRFQQQFDL